MRVRLALCALGTGLLLAGCSSLSGDNCPELGGQRLPSGPDNACDGNFLGAKNQRAALFTGDDVARLWNGEEARVGPNIDVSKLNPPPRPPGEYYGYVGKLRVDFPADDATAARDAANLKNTGASRFNPDEVVSLKFDKVSIDYFLKQVLGGALGINYVAPDDMPGSVTFRTETPVPKSRILQIVRDILARNGLVIKYLNGVYQIAKPDAMTALESTASAGRVGEQISRIIKLKRGSGAEVTALVKQLAPDEVTMLPTNAPDSIVVRGSPASVESVAELIESLSRDGISEDKIAIVPLRQSTPERIASQLTEFYRGRLGVGGAEQISIVPLERQQAVMIGSKDPRLMAGARELVGKLDRSAAEEDSLRIIPLSHLSAQDVAAQLTQIFGGGIGGGGGGGGGAAGGGGYAGGAVAGGGNSGRGAAGGPPGNGGGRLNAALATGGASLFPQARGQGGADGNDEDPSSGTASGFNLQGGLAGPRGGGRTAGVAPQAQPVSTGGGGAVKIVADPRANSIMIYSGYALYKRVRDVLAALDVQQSQVVIEATIVEVTLNDDLQYGVQAFIDGPGLHARSSSDPTATDGAKSGGLIQASHTFGSYKIEAVMRALQAVTTVKVISSPYLTVVDGKVARLVIGDQIPFSQRTQSSTQTGNVTVTEEIQTKDTGIILEVTPYIAADNGVRMVIDQSVTKPSDSILSGDKTPVISTRQVKSEVIIQSGRTVLLGGLVQERIDKGETGVPVLGKIPLVGDLFKQQNNKVSRTELIIMITPRVSRQAAQIENITRILRARTTPH